MILKDQQDISGGDKARHYGLLAEFLKRGTVVPVDFVERLQEVLVDEEGRAVTVVDQLLGHTDIVGGLRVGVNCARKVR